MIIGKILCGLIVVTLIIKFFIFLKKISKYEEFFRKMYEFPSEMTRNE